VRPLELWAGPECTLNRVGDRFHDQLARSGFADRLDDLDRLAGLGIRSLRFPLLWERTVPADRPGLPDWAWAAPRLDRLRTLGVAPIAGLVHHGSGPAFTHLLDPAFPALLAEYAGRVAQRFPHIAAYTPVNEPLTTARFSGLYGLWYPHRADDRSFVRALLHQVQGTVLAMRAIRQVNPHATLVQTEDLGFTSCTPALQEQADFDNLRRWLGFDLLLGRVTPEHGMWHFLLGAGADEAELQALLDEPCPPEVIGINHYLTSDRHLDHQVHLYPPDVVGGNGRQRYADVEAVRVAGVGTRGYEARLREAAERYRLPLAITEAHLGCTREEQLRWLQAAWRAAESVRQDGHDVRAVTCWAAFGSFDWNSLVTRDAGHYEPGLWDVRSRPPRPTALAALAGDLAAGRTPEHPVLAAPGWWQRDDRVSYPRTSQRQNLPHGGRPLLITGATGTLGRAFARLCTQRGLAFRVTGRDELDITQAASVQSALLRWQPWGVVNTAGWVRVDDAETDPRQWDANATGPALLAAACARQGVRLVSFSTDLVFDGARRSPYLEDDAARPLCAYGRAKHEAERQVLAAAPQSLVIRTAAFFGPWDAHNAVTLALDSLERGDPWTAAEDQVVSPTYVPDLVHATLDLLIDGEQGLWHLTNRGEVSWAQLARQAAEAAGLDAGLVCAVPGARLGQVAPRPAYAALGSQRGPLLPPLEDALSRYLVQRERQAGTSLRPLRPAA
jgi:dTDP-4-dehydrorhamnose reductase